MDSTPRFVRLGRSRRAAGTRDSGHYMPRQGLFDREQALTNIMEDLNESEVDPEDEVTGLHSDVSPQPPTAGDLELLSFYGPSQSSSGRLLSQQPQSATRHSQYTTTSAPGYERQWASPITPQTGSIVPQPGGILPQSSPAISTPLQSVGDTALVALVQNQQGLLQQLIKDQKSMLSHQEIMIKKQEELENKVKAMEGSISSSGSDERAKRKTKVTRQLSVCLIVQDFSDYIVVFFFLLPRT